MKSFFPKDKDVPSELLLEGIRIRQLKRTDNELDYQAVLESGFRPEGFPKLENLKQIARHEQDHNKKREFAYTILDKDETVCYGCLFIKPIVPFLKFAFFNDRIFEDLNIKATSPGFSFWITPKAWKMDLYPKLLHKLSDWFKNEWPFEEWFFLGLRPTVDELSEISKLNLKQIFLLQMENQKYILWQFLKCS